MRGVLAAILLLLLAVPVRAEVSPGRRAELKELVAEDCGACHGMTRQGGLGSPLLPAAMAALGEPSIVATILYGRPGTPMPPWKGLLSEEDAAYIARLLAGDADAR
jgi:cytochrome c55X